MKVYFAYKITKQIDEAFVFVVQIFLFKKQ